MKEKFKAFLKFSGLLLFLGLCMTMLSRGVKVYAASDMRLNVENVAIAKDGTFRLRAYNVPTGARVTYRSTDPSIAFIDKRGYITGISNGECVVNVTVIEGGTATATLQCNVLIGPAAISIKLTKTELVMKVGMKKTLKTIVSPLNTVEKPVFYSSEKNVASVTSIGRVKAKEVGEAVVFAFLENGQSAECSVYVLSDEDYEKYQETETLEGIVPDYGSEDIEGPDDENDENDENVSEDAETEKDTDAVKNTETEKNAEEAVQPTSAVKHEFNEKTAATEKVSKND